LFLYFLSLNQDVISTEDAHSLIVSIAAEKSAFAIAVAFLVVIPKGICFCFVTFCHSIKDVISTEDAHSFIVSIAAEKSAVALPLSVLPSCRCWLLLSFLSEANNPRISLRSTFPFAVAPASGYPKASALGLSMTCRE
jgi:hypothetical protein